MGFAPFDPLYSESLSKKYQKKHFSVIETPFFRFLSVGRLLSVEKLVWSYF
jgi:hypothetical protein